MMETRKKLNPRGPLGGRIIRKKIADDSQAVDSQETAEIQKITDLQTADSRAAEM